jgi:AbrB family looped-hinge helix DNA binding protein
MNACVKITDKGQITIPREIRNILKTKLVSFSFVDGVVILRPVHDVGGSLQKYARNAAFDASFQQIREAAWEKVLREKTVS